MMKRDMALRDVVKRDEMGRGCAFVSNHESGITNHAWYFGGKLRLW